MTSSAWPLMRSVSSSPGIKNSSATLSLVTRFWNESSRLLPEKSAQPSRPLSSTWTKPGGPPFGDPSHTPAAFDVDKTKNGDFARKSTQ